jgi:4-hydroxy-2-oxoheptanedioate aldolase
MPVQLKPTFADRLRDADRPLIGLWNTTANAVSAEILAGSGADLILFDGEHGLVGVENLVHLLQATEAYPATAVVRVPWNDPVLIKRFLETGAQNVIVPMISTPQQAAAAAQAVRYPPHGIRGIGSALGRASRWARVPDYVPRADDLVSLTVQIETTEAVQNVRAIAEVDGVDALFIGPTDLSGSMGFPGSASVAETVLGAITTAREAGAKVGVNAFAPEDADRYLAAGAHFVMISADVTILARGAESMVARHRHG